MTWPLVFLKSVFSSKILLYAVILKSMNQHGFNMEFLGKEPFCQIR